MNRQIAKHMAIQSGSNANNACEAATSCSCNITHKI